MSISVPTKDPIPYVLESDEDKPEEQRTVYHVWARTNATGNKISTTYARARTVKGGREKIDHQALTTADVSTFLATVSKVEKFMLHPDSDSQPVKALTNGEAPNVDVDGIMHHSITAEDRPALTAVAQCMCVTDLNAIFEAANDMSELRKGERRSL